MKTTVVTTTINQPTFLLVYANTARFYGKEVDFIVIGDKKSPSGIEEVCGSVSNCIYVSPEAQDRYLERFPELKEHLIWNSIARRNIGHVMAYENGANTIIMLDDDNLDCGYDFVAEHQVGVNKTLDFYSSRSGWFNICKALVEKHGVEFYARGYPPAQRWKDGVETSRAITRKVAVNGGLWLNDPDIDALTRLERHLITTGTKQEFPKSFGLMPGTWSPWNCQNTAISREALPSYFLSPWAGRHLDIWASYITTRIADQMGQAITFGTPLAYHDRSPHNLYTDLEQELPWIRRTDHFCDVLRNTSLDGLTYLENLRQITQSLERNLLVDATPEPVIRDRYVRGLRAWQATFDRLGAQ